MLIFFYVSRRYRYAFEDYKRENLVYCLVPIEEEACLMLGKRLRIGLDNLVFKIVLHVEAIDPEKGSLPYVLC